MNQQSSKQSREATAEEHKINADCKLFKNSAAQLNKGS